jgi:hypothetical protein
VPAGEIGYTAPWLPSGPSGLDTHSRAELPLSEHSLKENIDPMKNFCFVLPLLAALIFSGIASGQATRTWVSGVGDDANPCSRTAPCATFAGTISKTAAAGEINCLDPGDFGPVTITKSLTIDCGFTGGLQAAGVDGIDVNDTTGAAVVILRNMSISGAAAGSPGLKGISFLAGKSLHIEHIKIYGFTTSCIDVNVGTAMTLTVNDSKLSECGTNGISVVSSSGIAHGDFYGDEIWNVAGTGTTNGINAGSNSRLAIRNCEIAFASVGVNQTGASPGSTVTVQGSSFSLNGTALISAANSGIAVGKSVFYLNGTVFGGGNITSFGDNLAFLNTILGGPPLAPQTI